MNLLIFMIVDTQVVTNSQKLNNFQVPKETIKLLSGGIQKSIKFSGISFGPRKEEFLEELIKFGNIPGQYQNYNYGEEQDGLFLGF